MAELNIDLDLDIKPSPLDLKVLEVLVQSDGRIVGRDYIARQTGIDNSSARRVDASLVSVRRWLGPDSLVTVRRRGWMLTAVGLQLANYIIESLGTPL